MVSEHVIHAVFCFQLAECFTCGLHICFVRVLVNKIADDEHDIRFCCLNAFHVAGKSVAVKGCAEMRIGKHDDAEDPDGFVGIYRIVGFDDIMRRVPACRKPQNGENHCNCSGIIAAEVLFA